MCFTNHVPKINAILFFTGLIKHHTMYIYEAVEAQLHTFLVSALDGGDQSASWPR